MSKRNTGSGLSGTGLINMRYAMGYLYFPSEEGYKPAMDTLKGIDGIMENFTEIMSKPRSKIIMPSSCGNVMKLDGTAGWLHYS